MRNHTATHLLHRELRNLFGKHVLQAGSLVAPERLRFDFTYGTALSRTELSQLAHSVNYAILANHPITIRHEKHDNAVARGATALFGEKYGEIVRTVQIGADDPVYSLELCGGTHVTNTAEIGPFVITAEGSVGAGTRRIEALTGRAALEHLNFSLDTLADVCTQLQVGPDELSDKIVKLLDAQTDAQSERADANLHYAHNQFESAITGATEILGVPYMAARVDVADASLLRTMTDWYSERYPGGVVIIGAQIDSRVSVVVRVSKNLTERGLHAGNLAARISKQVGGRGGGTPTLAQGGGKQISRLDSALSQAEQLVGTVLREHN
jgi:alanyl-tRNA synthetase